MYIYILNLHVINYKSEVLLAITSAGLQHRGTFWHGMHMEHLLENQSHIFQHFLYGKLNQENYWFMGESDSLEKIKDLKQILLNSPHISEEESIFDLYAFPVEKI